MVRLDAEGDGCGLIAGHDDQEDEQAASWRDGSGKIGRNPGPELPRRNCSTPAWMGEVGGVVTKRLTWPRGP